jgi:hypothetical protein
MNPYRHPTPRPYPVEIRYIPANAVVGALKGILAGLLGATFVVGMIVLFSGCTPAEVATTNAVLSDVAAGCMAAELAASVVPAGTVASVVAADLKLVCPLVNVAETDIEAVITAFEKNQTDAGVGMYVPSPHVRAVKSP